MKADSRFTIQFDILSMVIDDHVSAAIMLSGTECYDHQLLLPLTQQIQHFDKRQNLFSSYTITTNSIELN